MVLNTSLVNTQRYKVRIKGKVYELYLHRGAGEGATRFPGLLHFTLDTYLIMLSIKQGCIMYQF